MRLESEAQSYLDEPSFLMGVRLRDGLRVQGHKIPLLVENHQRQKLPKIACRYFLQCHLGVRPDQGRLPCSQRSVRLREDTYKLVGSEETHSAA